MAGDLVTLRPTAVAPLNASKYASWRTPAIAGFSVIFLTFGVIGGWAAVAKIDKAVVAQAFVAVETNRKTVQHFEGGIVREIAVKEGEHVQQGQIVLRLQQVQAEANFDLIRTQLNGALALEARLSAERQGLSAIRWPKELDSAATQPSVASIIADQKHQFDERRASLQGQTEVLQSRITQLGSEIDGVAREKESAKKQVSYINDELVNLRALAAKQLVPATRVFSMERERTRLDGVIGRADADVAKAKGSISEVRIQIDQLKQKFQEDVASSLLDARQKIADLRQRLIVANDVLSRIDIPAPLSGTVQNLKVYTLGQVVRAGEPLLDIVPDEEHLVVNAQFSPSDIDSVHGNQEAEIRFPSFHSRTTPVMMGKLESISKDRLYDEQTRQYYFLGLISLNRADIPEEYRPRVRAGMPAEVIVASGERTVLSYIVSPLASSFRKTFREE